MGILSAKEAAFLLLDGVLKISPLDAAQIQPASIVLRLGAELEIPEPGQAVDPAVSGARPKSRTAGVEAAPHALAPGQCAAGSTLETLELPSFCCASVCALNDLALLGVETGSCRLDPRFSGRIRLFIRNAGACTVMLRAGMPICRLELFSLHEPPAPWRRSAWDEDRMRETAEFMKREFEDKKPHGALSRYLEESIRTIGRKG